MPDDSVTVFARNNAALVLADGRFFFGQAIGYKDGGHLIQTIGEMCFNTTMSGYQEVLTDPSYAGQIITFTFPHIGNVGTNAEDIESEKPLVKGVVLRAGITNPANFRGHMHLDAWLNKQGIAAICGIDTRALTHHIRKHGAQNAAIVYFPNAMQPDLAPIVKAVNDFPSLKNMELAKAASSKLPSNWQESAWERGRGYGLQEAADYHVVAVDYGAKRNILRSLSQAGCKISVVPADTSAEDILKYKPDGVFLSNGPGDPAATGEYALPVIKQLLEKNTPLFGICLGHQLLGLALGCKTEKMHQGHRGANHPVKDLRSGKVEITSQNHGFVIQKSPIPDDVEVTHVSLFDGTVQGIRSKSKPAFSVQGHPEASPGPHDSLYLFGQFIEEMKKHNKKPGVKEKKKAGNE